MTMMTKLVYAGIGIALLCSNIARAADKPEHVFNLAMQNPRGHPLALGAEKFAELIATKSAGKIRIEIFTGGTQGTDAANVAALQNGTLDLLLLNSGILSSQVQDFEVFDLPFLFNNYAEADAVVDGPIGQHLHEQLRDKGLIGLAYWELGFRQLTNNKHPITSVKDIAGLKVRVIPNAINIEWVQALHAYPFPMPFRELYAALKNKIVDGEENPGSVILANKFYEVQRYMTLTNHQYNPQSMLISKAVWDKLSKADSKIMRDAAIEAGKYQRKIARESAADALEKLKKEGMRIVVLPPAEMAKLRDLIKPVIQKHGAAIAETSNAVFAELKKMRK